VSQDTSEAFASLRSVLPSPKTWAEPTLQARHHALGLPTLAVDAAVEATPHLTSILGARPLPAGPAAIDPDHRRADPEFFAAEPMVILTVEPSVGEKAIKRDILHRLAHRRLEAAVISARTSVGEGTRDQVRGRVHDERELRPARELVSAATSARAEVRAYVAALESCGIDRGLRPLADQAARSRTAEYSDKQALEAFVCSKRSSAKQRVE